MKRGIVFAIFLTIFISQLISAENIDPFKNINGYQLAGFYPLSENQLLITGVSYREIYSPFHGYLHTYSLFDLQNNSYSSFSFDSQTYRPAGWSKDYVLLKYSDSYLQSQGNNFETFIDQYFSYNLNTGELKDLGKFNDYKEMLGINPDDNSFYYSSMDQYADNNGMETWYYVNSYNLSNGQNKSLFRLVWPSTVSFIDNSSFQVNLDGVSASNGILVLFYSTTESAYNSKGSQQPYNLTKYLAYYNLSSGNSIPIDIKQFPVVISGKTSLGDGKYNFPDSGAQTDGKIILWPEYNYKKNGEKFAGFYYYNLSDGKINKLDILDSAQPLPNFMGSSWELKDEKIVWVDNRNLNLPIVSNIVEATYRGISDNLDIYYYDIASGLYKQVTKNKGDQFNPQIKGNTIFWQDVNRWWTNPDNLVTSYSTISYIKINNLQ